MRNFKKKVIDKLLNISDSLWQFIKFGIVGISNSAISLTVYYTFIFINKDLYLWGNLAGWIIGVLNAFYWGNKIVFVTEGKKSLKILLLRLLKSYTTYGFTFLLTQGLLFIQINCLDISEWIAPIINIILVTPINFIINKFWTFKK